MEDFVKLSGITSPDYKWYNPKKSYIPSLDGSFIDSSVDTSTTLPEDIRFSNEITHGFVIEIYGLDIKNSDTPTFVENVTNVVGGLVEGTVGSTLSGLNMVGFNNSLLLPFLPKGTAANNIPQVIGSGVTKELNKNTSTAIKVISSSTIPKAYLTLPIPNDVNFSYNASWGAAELTLPQYLIRSLIKNRANPEQVGEAFMKGAAAEIWKNLVGRTIGLGVVRAGGVVINPYKQLMYDSPDFRQFSFNWTLSPKNASESVALDKIIWYLKKHMHPTTTGSQPGQANSPSLEDSILWLAPDFINIMFVTNNDGFRKFRNPWIPLINEAVITGVGVQIDPKFHNNDNAPTAINLTINLMETKLYSQDDFGKTYEDYKSQPI